MTARHIGIDVARWQAVVPWHEVASAGISFAYVKATHGLGIDPRFFENWSASKGLLPRGAYHWLTDQDAVLQAEHIARTLEQAGDLGELVVAVDFEEPSTQFRGQPLLVHLLRCLRRVRELTGAVAMYSGRWYIDQYLGMEDGALVEELVEIPYWHAEYPRVEIADRRACGLAPPNWPPPHLPKMFAKRGIAQALYQADGDGGCVLPNGVDVDFNIATDEGLTRMTRSSHRDTDPAPAPEDDTAKTVPDAPSPIRRASSMKMAAVNAPIIDADDGRAVTPIRAGDGEHEPEDAS